MALINCPECGRKVSDKADACMNCGFPIQEIQKNVGLINCPDCGKEVSDETDICMNCGFPIREMEKTFDVKEKTESEINKQSAVVKKNNSKKKYIFVGVLVLVLGIGIYIMTTVPLTDEAKIEKIYDVYLSGDYEGAMQLTYDYFGVSDLSVSIMMTMEDPSKDDIVDEINIRQDLIKDGNYYDYYITFENTSDETITYIKYTVFFKNEDGDIIHSDWSNWSGTLLPDAEVQDDTMIDYIEGVESYSVTIDEVNY